MLSGEIALKNNHYYYYYMIVYPKHIFRMEARLKSTNLIAQGKRNLICSEVPAAVERFQGACEIL